MGSIARQRLHNQRLSTNPLDTPADVVAWFGAVQSQDYAGAKWALSLRTPSLTDSAIEAAFNAGALLRTHVLRPTWHFVTPADIRWLLALTGPRVIAGMASRHRELSIDSRLLARSHDALARALAGGNQLTRSEAAAVLERAGIALDVPQRFAHLIMHAELKGIICSGARRGKEHTYALLDDRVPPTRTLDREEAVAELVRRYFSSHGPATIRDFAWWSGLTTADARAGLEMTKSQLVAQVVEGETYWSPPPPRPTRAARTVHLLPNFDEYLVAYTDRRAVLHPAHRDQLAARRDGLLTHTIVINGLVVGTWRRSSRRSAVRIEPAPFAPLTPSETRALAAAARRYSQFLEQPVELT